MSKRRPVRLKDIAEELSVSTVTVSKALAGKDGVGENLRAEIIRLATARGYKPKVSKMKPAISDLSSGTIGILIPSRFYEDKSSFYWVLYSHLTRELQNASRFALMELLEPASEDACVLPRMVSEGRVEGLIILGQVHESYIRFLQEVGKPFIFLDFYSEVVPCDAVVTDNYHSMYRLVSWLIEQGHQDIRFVGSFRSTSSIQDRYMGFVKAMLVHGLEVSSADIIEDRDSECKFKPLVLPQPLPGAFVCNCDEIAGILVRTLQMAGFKVPDDVSVVGFDNYPVSPHDLPGITTVEVNAAAMAKATVDTLLRKVAGKRYHSGRLDIPGRLVIKDSVRPL